MKHRIFIAINLPEEIKTKLVNYQLKWQELPIKWTKKDNLHITLEFLGYVANNELLEICQNTKELVSKFKTFTITLNKICYGPPKKMPPRMVWAEGTCPELVEGKKIDRLSQLQKDLENSLLTSPIKGTEQEAKPYIPHITLGRIRAWEFKQIEPEERPEVDEEIDLNFEVYSIEVMESQLKKGGAEYAVLESAPLKS